MRRSFCSMMDEERSRFFMEFPFFAFFGDIFIRTRSIATSARSAAQPAMPYITCIIFYGCQPNNNKNESFWRPIPFTVLYLVFWLSYGQVVLGNRAMFCSIHWPWFITCKTFHDETTTDDDVPTTCLTSFCSQCPS